MTVATARMADDQIRWLVGQAARAPSVHNSQPWRFVWKDGHLDLYADTTRGLTAGDPDGREMVVSCGAALFNLRVAARKLDAVARVTLLPDARDPRWLARVQIEAALPADADERRAYAGLLRRHTHRGEFETRPVPPALSVRLQREAEAEGAQLIFVHEPGRWRRVLQLAQAAELHLRTDERARAEVEAWTRVDGDGRRDGVPDWSFAADVPADPGELPVRDFDLGRGIGRLPPGAAPPGGIAVLTTERDLQPDWLIAGQALERVLVTAAQDWAFATLQSQLVEVPNLRAELQRELSIPGYAQILLRLGYSHDAPHTRRRDVGDVLQLADRP